MKINYLEQSKILQEGGIVCKVTRHNFKCYKKMTFKDMGIAEEDPEFQKTWKDYIVDGKMRLFSPEYVSGVEKIQGAVYNELKGYAYPFAIKTVEKGEKLNAWLLPKDKKDEFLLFFYDKRKELEDLKTEMMDKYDEIIEATLRNHRELAEKKLKDYTKTELDRYMEALAQKVPGIEDINTISISFEQEYVTLPPEISTKRLQFEHNKKMLEIREETEREKQKKLFEIEIEQAKLAQEARKKLIENTVGAFHSEFIDKAAEFLQDINKEGKMTRGNSRRLSAMLDSMFNTLNFAADTSGEFENKLNDLKRQYNLKDVERDLGEIKTTITDLAEMSVEGLKSIGLDQKISDNIFGLIERR